MLVLSVAGLDRTPWFKVMTRLLVLEPEVSTAGSNVPSGYPKARLGLHSGVQEFTNCGELLVR